MEKIIGMGAEAILIHKDGKLIKRRTKKGYRLDILDEKLRKQRTKKESKLLEKASKLIPVPKILKTDEKGREIDMEFIEGKKLSEHLDNLKNAEEVCKQIGQNIAKLHDADIIHGDLTTSNMIYAQEKTKNPNKKFISQLAELKKLNLPTDKYAIFGSGPLAIRGIRDSKDLDIIVKASLWNELTKKYPEENERLIKINSTEVYKDWSPWFSNTNELIDNADIFDGIRFVKLRYLIAWKKAYNREKDKRDIQLIEKHLETGKVFFIDFGLGFESKKIEDKAVDLHLIKQALEAKHFNNYERFFKAVLEGYKISKRYETTISRLKAVEKRGRYKQAY